MTSSGITLELDPALSVNDVLQHVPDSLRVLNAFGLDTCCGGHLSLREAANDVGVDAGEIIAAIRLVATARQPRPVSNG